MPVKRKQSEPAKPDANLAILSTANADWIVKRGEWVSCISKHMPDVTMADPGSLYMAPYDGEVLQNKVQDASSKNSVAYVCAGNLMWVDHATTVNPGVPVNAQKVLGLKKSLNLQPGDRFTSTIQVAISHKMGKPVNKGKVPKISPDEPVDAVLWTIADSLAAAKEDDLPALIAAWKSTLLNCEFEWRFCDSEDAKYFHCLNYREARLEEAKAMEYDAIQIVYDVWSFRMRKGGTHSAKQLSQLYDEHVKFSSRAEPRTESFIDSCITIAKRMLVVPEIKDLLAKLQGMPEFPLNSISKLQLVIEKCQSSAKMTWWLSKLIDDLMSNAREIGEISARNIRTNHKTSITDIYLMKRQMKLYMLGPQLDNSTMHSSRKSTIRSVMNSVDSYRKQLRPHCGTDSVDATFLSTWLPSELKYLEYVETTVYSNNPTVDSAIRVGMKNGRAHDEILLQYSPFKDYMAEFNELIKTESEHKDADASGVTDAKDAEDSKQRGGTNQIQVPLFMVQESDDEPDANIPKTGEKLTMVSLPAEDLEPFRILAANTVQQFNKLIVEPAHATQLFNLLEAAPIATLKCDKSDGNMLIFCDMNGYGEAKHRPDIRKPPLPRGALAKLVNAVQRCRWKGAEERHEAAATLAIGDVWCFIDAGKNRDTMVSKLMRPAGKDHPKKHADGKTVKNKTLLYKSEKSVMMQRRFNKKSSTTKLQLTESMLEFYNGQTVMQNRNRKHYEGTTRSDVMGPLEVPGCDQVPQVTYAFKQQFWQGRLIAVGGKATEADEGENNNDEEEEDEDDLLDDDPDIDMNGETLPLTCHQLPRELFEEVLHASWAKSVIDLMPNVGLMAKVCISLHIGYLGICHNVCQKEYIEEELTNYVLSQMACPSSRLYNAAYGKLLSGLADAKGKDTSTGISKTKPEKDEPKEEDPEEVEDIHDEDVETNFTPRAKKAKVAAAKKKTKDTSKGATGSKGGDEPKVPKSLADMLAAAKARMSSGSEP